MTKTIDEINEKIKKGKAIVVTAEEIIGLAKEKGIKKAAQEVDVVTTGTFAPMCSSGAYFNIGQPKPRIDPRNRLYPGEFNYGGGHVIEELVAGKDVRLMASAYGTDCYPRKKLESLINIENLNQAVLFNIRNAYQNYNVAVNLSDKTIYTYLGMLKPNMGNAYYCSAGQLSPLFNDPYYKTIGIGSRIFLGGGTGYVSWQGTQHNPSAPRTKKGIPKRPAGTIAVIGDLKEMSPRYLVGTSMQGYCCTISVGIGVPIPILSEEMLEYTMVTDEDILAPVIDYSDAYPKGKADVITEVSYAELRSGSVKIKGKEVPTASFSSYPMAVEIAGILKEWITGGKFTLTEPVELLPGAESGVTLKPFKGRPLEE